jgi:hypothetical protein
MLAFGRFVALSAVAVLIAVSTADSHNSYLLFGKTGNIQKEPLNTVGIHVALLILPIEKFSLL